MQQNKTSFEMVYEENFSYVYNFVYMRVMHRETAEDITSQVFLNALSHYDSFDPDKASARTWLCTIARNTVINHVKSGRSQEIPTEELPETPIEDDYGLRQMEINKEARRILIHLTEEERDLLALRYSLEMPVKDIAEMYGIDPKAMTERYRRLLTKCRKYTEGGSMADY
ncbi:MAG: sigma-70 family RNA polymerase sigma factor [Butyrivibrio sp.]|nr:sigma-70 family RNA polymerase sigma factor [Butyrivibrio sp.]